MKLVSLFIFVLSVNVFAADEIVLPLRSADFKTSDALMKVENVISNPQDILEDYKPAGGVIKDKKVNNNEVTFKMIKKVIIFSKTINIQILVNHSPDSSICGKGIVGYKYELLLDGSDDIVTNNVDKVDIDICLTEKSKDWVTASFKTTLYKGDNYSEPVGSIAVGTIKDQVDPLIESLNNVMAKASL